MAESQTITLLRRTDVELMLGLSRSSIYTKINAKDKGYDPDFPVPIRVSGRAGAKRTAVRWVRSEVEAYIASRQRTRQQHGGVHVQGH